MLKLDRIMWIAREHATSCCGPGEVGAENHNIQVLSVAIQEALAENDDEATRITGNPDKGGGVKTNGPRGVQKGGPKNSQATPRSKVEVRGKNGAAK